MPPALHPPPAPRTVAPDARDGLRSADPPRLSIVVPANDEAASLGPLVAEVEAAVIARGIDAELIVVDDGSADGTAALLRRLAGDRPWLRPIRLARRSGQSLALGVGIAAARAETIATLDADGQNDPADLPRLLEVFDAGGVDLVQGRRIDRQDPAMKRLAGGVGRVARRLVLADPVADTGCSLRVVDARFARQWPLHLAGMHRFLPALAAMRGAVILEVSVGHRPRDAGVSHYGSLGRGVAGFFDLLAVRWMRSRHRDTPGQRRAAGAAEASEASEASVPVRAAGVP